MTDQASLSAGTTSEDYADDYYDHRLGPAYTYDEPHWKAFFGVVADNLIALLEPGTSYDAGCAKGFLVRALAERGVDARGGDISEAAVTGAPVGLAERLEVRDLTQPFGERFDLVSCIEVLEHMSADDAQLAITSICDATDLVLLSTTPDDFAEPTHINIRQPAEWARDFARRGFFRRTDVDASFLSPWAVVLERRRATAVDVVGRYEALLAPLNREVIEKRRGLLEAQRDVDAARSPDRGPLREVRAELAALTKERDALATRLEELSPEHLRQERLDRLAMADELIGLRAEIAQAAVAHHARLVAVSDEAHRLRVALETGPAAGPERRIAQARVLRQRLGPPRQLPRRVLRRLRRELSP